MNGPQTNLFPRQLAVVLLASALGLPSLGQSAPAAAAPSTPAAAQDQPSPPAITRTAAREGFWGRINPFARKKWVKKQTDPLNDRLSELDQASARNGRAIDDVDQRAQSGVRRAQSTADGAQQAADAAGARARAAGSAAQGAQAEVDGLSTTVAGLDNYQQTSEVVVDFRGGQPVITAAAKEKLDELAKGLAGREGYLLEIEGRAPQAGTSGIETSGKLSEAVRRYLVTEHEIPVYRLRAVGLGNAQEGQDQARVRTSQVRIRVMENSLAARDGALPHGAASANGAERP